jgi:hypothetical protein
MVNDFNSNIGRETVSDTRRAQFNDSIIQDQVYLRNSGCCKPFICPGAIFYTITTYANLLSDKTEYVKEL